jgi:hypothetical protein
MNGIFLPHEIEQRFYGKRSCRLLRTRERDRFEAARVDLVDLGLPDMILGASVVFREDASFTFADELDRPEGVSPAFVILCRDDDDQAIDIVAWSPSSERLATWLGRAWAIDESRVLQPRPSECDALAVFRDPFQWLRNRREGIVILDVQRAKWEFAYLGCTLLVDDVSHGQALRETLTIAPPQIFVAPSVLERRAA